MATTMTIYSWNIFYRNERLDDAFDFIAHADADVFCLQEVPETFLARLQSLPYSVVSARETNRVYRGVETTSYLVILSRYPFRKSGDIPLPFRDQEIPLRGRLFVWLMVTLRVWGTLQNFRNAMYAEVETPSGTVRVFNLHFSLIKPAWRIEEFDTALASHDPALPAIVCGDFNSLESPKISILNWLFGGSLADAVLYRRERIELEKHFAAHRIANPLRGRVTHDLAQSQLDHILVSDSFTISDANVIAYAHGSDHHPISVDALHT